MRVFSGALGTETNTFAPMPTGLASFQDRGYYKAGQHPGELTWLAGPLIALGWSILMRADCVERRRSDRLGGTQTFV